MENTRWISLQIPINNPVQTPPSEAGKPEGGAFWEESPLKLPQREIFFRPGDIFTHRSNRLKRLDCFHAIPNDTD